jgi:hypothetical protein
LSDNEIDGKRGPLDESHFAAAKQKTIALNEDGFRGVAVAYKEIDDPKAAYAVVDDCATLALFALCNRHAVRLCGPDAPSEVMVRATLGNVRKAP